MRYWTSLIGAAAFASALGIAAPPATAQVVSFDDSALFGTLTDAEEVSIPDSQTAFPDSQCGSFSDADTGEGSSVSIPFDGNSLTVTPTVATTLCIFDDEFTAPSSNTDPSTMDGNTIVGNGEDDYTIVFDTPVSVFGMRLLTNNAHDETITLKDEFDAEIETIDIDPLTAENDRQFVGFHSSTPIKTVLIDTENGANQNEGIDRLYVGDNFFEILHLVDTGTTGDGISTIHEVALDDAFDLAILTPIDTAACALGSVAEGVPGGVPYNGVDALAGTPDGTHLVFVNDTNPGTNTDDEIVRLNLATGECTELAQVDFGDPNVNDSDQLAYSPGGVLYIGRNQTDEVHTIIPDTGDTALVGVLTDGATCDTLDLAGSDWTFDHEGDLWVWINLGTNTRGLYEVTQENLENPDDGFVCASGAVLADFIGNDTTIVDNFTGWATRLNGVGNVVGSKANSDEMKELDSTVVPDGSLVTDFAMVDGALDPFDHTFGDMSNGPLALCGNRTLGYFKTHLDAENRKGKVPEQELVSSAGVTLCDDAEDEFLNDDDIVEVLNDAKGSNFSMLSAQLLVATLNCDFANDGEYDGDCNEAGFPLIQAGEDFLCANVNVTTNEWWNTDFVDNTQQDEANALADMLDDFNNQVANENFCELVSAEQ